jgi:hypothetical protein
LHLNRIPTKLALLLSALAIAATAIGLDAATSFGGSSAKPRHRSAAAARRRACAASTKKKTKHDGKHAATNKRCSKQKTTSKGASSGVHEKSSTSTASSGSSTSSQESQAQASAEPAAASSGEPFRFFASTSSWNEPLPEKTERDPNAGSILSQLNGEITHGKETGEAPQTTIDTTDWSVPVYTVPASQPAVKVTLHTPKPDPALQAAFNAVPLPADAKPAVGTDALLAVWQPSTDKLWEFWQLAHSGEGWTASYGGAMQNVSGNPGVYGPEAWPGANSNWGASSCSMAMVGGLITLEDLKSGKINHALMIAIPHVRAGVYSSPAKRTDGKYENPLDLPEGAHLRLPSDLNLASLHLPKLDLWIAEAAQRYGIYVCLGGVNIGFFGQDPTPTGTNPYTGPGGYFEGQPANKIIEQFPWKDLVLLKMELHSMS